MIIAQNKETQFKIIRASDASAAEIHAVEELQNFLHKITGAYFQIYLEGEPIYLQAADPQNGYESVLLYTECTPKIFVGDIDFGKRNNWEKKQDLGNEGFSLQTKGDNLYLIGGRPRGVIYAVYSFLEKYCGCRWFNDEVSLIPTRVTLEIPFINDTQVPMLEYREPYYAAYPTADWHVRNKCNGDATLLSQEHGGKVKYFPFVHSFNEILDPKEYFSVHPEYFSEINGVRACPEGRTQLCLTNPEVLAIAKAKVREWIHKNPDVSIISISQNDWFNFCTCEKCRAIDESEGSHMGTMLNFVNAIADDIAEEYPNISIDTLAYQYTRTPPKTLRPRKNVIIRLCSIECCFAHPFTECDGSFASENGSSKNSFVNDVLEWAKICDRLYVWDYVVNFNHNILPHPNFGVLQKNIQFLAKNHVKGIFEQGNSFVGKYGEFDLLKRYVLAKLLWNPYCDMDTVVNEYLVGVYGGAAAEVRKYYDMLQNLVKSDTHINIFENPDAPYITDEFLQDADACLARAERAADNEERLGYVKALRLSIQYSQLSRMPVSNPERKKLLDTFAHEIKAAGIETFYCRQPMDKALQILSDGKNIIK